MEKNRSVSVVIPYYNEKKTINLTLDRLAEQTRLPEEVILVDSGSTDGCFETIQEWIRHYTGGIQFINLPARLGMPSSSRNLGIRMARNEYIAHMDCGLMFPVNWLESQILFLSQYRFQFVSPAVVLMGVNTVDRCAAAHTYGHNRPRAILPGSLIHKSIFQKVGMLIEGKRAGDDLDWVNRVRKSGIPRGFNQNIKIEYLGTNYAASLGSLFRKIRTYSEYEWGISGHRTPLIYVILFLTLPAFAYFLPESIPPLIAAYFLLRGYIIPGLKSRGFRSLVRYPATLLALPWVGLVIDSAKLCGYIKSVLGLTIQAKT